MTNLMFYLFFAHNYVCLKNIKQNESELRFRHCWLISTVLSELSLPTGITFGALTNNPGVFSPTNSEVWLTGLEVQSVFHEFWELPEYLDTAEIENWRQSSLREPCSAEITLTYWIFSIFEIWEVWFYFDFNCLQKNNQWEPISIRFSGFEWLSPLFTL